LGNVSACVNHLQSIKKQVCKSVKAGYQGSNHSDVDTSSLAWRVANRARDFKFQFENTNRDMLQMKFNADLRSTGRQKFESASLTTFNKKVQDLKAGNTGEGEMDEIAAPNFHIAAPDNIG
jgi:hypothetical protein